MNGLATTAFGAIAVTFMMVMHALEGGLWIAGYMHHGDELTPSRRKRADEPTEFPLSRELSHSALLLKPPSLSVRSGEQSWRSPG